MELYNHEAEQVVLGSLLNNKNGGALVMKRLSDTSFYFSKHKVIYASILSLWEQSIATDIITVGNDLEKAQKLNYVGGNSYLADIIAKSVDFSNLPSYVEIINNWARLRDFYQYFFEKSELIKTGKISQPEEILKETTEKLLNFNFSSKETNTTIQEINEIYTKIQEEFAEKKAQGFDHIGIPTKFSSLDRATDGFQPECLWTIAAFTSVGKTSFMLNLVKKLIDQGKTICIFSLEMSKEDIYSKLLALEVEVSPVEITKGFLDNEIYAKQNLAKQKMKNANLSIYTECVNVEDIIITMQAEMLRSPVEVFFIDYVQNLTSKKSIDQFRMITQAVKDIQTATRKLKTTTVLLSQISNESNKSGGVLEVGGKDAGAIRAASNVFIYLKRDGTEEEILEKYRTGEDIPLKLILNKNRMGRIGSFNLKLKQASGIMYESY